MPPPYTTFLVRRHQIKTDPSFHPGRLRGAAHRFGGVEDARCGDLRRESASPKRIAGTFIEARGGVAPNSPGMGASLLHRAGKR